MVMRCACLVALLLAMAPRASHAQRDDSIGVYFDAEAVTTCTTMAPFTPFDCYLVLANPTAPVDGFECTVSYAGGAASHYFILEQDLGAGAVDSDPLPGGYAVTTPEPYPVSGDRIVLCRWRMLMMSSLSLDILVGPGTAPTLPYEFPVLFAEGVPRPARTVTCDAALPVASVNGWCPIAVSYPCTAPPFDVLSLGVSVYGPSRSDVATMATGYDATDGFDEGLDVPRPAPAGPGYLAVSFEHPDWPGGPRFAIDKGARFDYGSEFRSWTLLVETDLDGPIRIARDFSYLVDDFRLRDLQTGQVQEMLPYGEYLLFWNDGTPVTRRYQLISGSWNPVAPVATALPAAIPRLTASPNPFNPRTVLGFELARPARAGIRVLTLRGEEVCVLGREAYPDGRHELEWRGLDHAGRSVPSGTYLAQLCVDGIASGAAVPLTLLR